MRVLPGAHLTMTAPFKLADCDVSIVGLGLMGGSLALALRDACRTLTGVDTDARTLEVALANGIIDEAASFEAAQDCDLLILAAPVRAILGQLERLASTYTPPRETVVLDLGSTKKAILEAMAELPPRFEPIGGHPMCGKEVGGLAHATADLYRDKVFVIVPPGYSSVRALALTHELINTIGAHAMTLSADRHDKLAALISHLPYTVAVALMRAVMAQGDEKAWELAASGFRDTSRLAASELTMMTDILLTNRNSILEALAAYRAELDALEAVIRQGDAEAVRAALASAQAQRAELFRE
jgi:prephenate dehydrogenase